MVLSEWFSSAEGKQIRLLPAPCPGICIPAYKELASSKSAPQTPLGDSLMASAVPSELGKCAAEPSQQETPAAPLPLVCSLSTEENEQEALWDSLASVDRSLERIRLHKGPHGQPGAGQVSMENEASRKQLYISKGQELAVPWLHSQLGESGPK